MILIFIWLAVTAYSVYADLRWTRKQLKKDKWRRANGFNGGLKIAIGANLLRGQLRLLSSVLGFGLGLLALAQPALRLDVQAFATYTAIVLTLRAILMALTTRCDSEAQTKLEHLHSVEDAT